MPILTVYFGYGLVGAFAVGEFLWVKELGARPADLAALAALLSLPWTIKMVFGQLVDTVPLFGSRRRSYILAGAVLIIAAYLILAGAASGLLSIASKETLYIFGSFLNVIGLVLQDAAADAMSAEVVPRTGQDGSSRPQAEVSQELAVVQVLGRLALAAGAVLGSLFAPWIAEKFSSSTVFALALIVPAISIIGALFVRTEPEDEHRLTG